VYTPARTREYEYLVGDYARAAVKTSGWMIVPGEYALQVTVYRVRRAGDLDNYLKAISDGLNGIVWPDDAMVRTLIAFADLSRDNPRADITVGRYL
jgi:Holliday junction resolvase RusA-like endonuclease